MIQKQIDRLQSQTNNKLKIILQLIQQNVENIKKRINAKQMTENLQILQKTQSLQTFFLSFQFYMLMQFKIMKHDAIYLNSSTEALYVC